MNKDVEKIAEAAVSGGIFVSFWKWVTGRKKDKINFWKSQFEGAQKIVAFWQENGEKLLHDMEVLTGNYNKLHNDYEILNAKYSLVIAQNKGLEHDVSELVKEVNRLKNATL